MMAATLGQIMDEKSNKNNTVGITFMKNIAKI